MATKGALSILNTLYIPFGSRGVTRASASAIKTIKYNQENKSLFGSLLETAAERRKRLKNEVVGSIFDDVERPVPLIKPPKHLECEENKEMLDRPKEALAPKKKKTKVLPEVTTLASKKEKTEAPQKEPTENISPCGINTVPQTLLDEKTIKSEIFSSLKKCSEGPLTLPESVIHNLTSFPMVNNTSDIEIDERPNELIVLENVKLYPSVSKVLNLTKSDGSLAALKRWRAKMIVQLGEEGFMQYYKAPGPVVQTSLKLTRSFHSSASPNHNLQLYIKGLLSRGSEFHSMLQSYLQGEEPTINAEMEGCWASLQTDVMNRLGNVQAIEQPLVHPWLLYRGILDCVAVFDGEPMLIEWKKSDKQKPQLENTYDAPLQLASYLGALNFDPAMKMKVKGGVVVVAYSDGSPAEAFPLSISDCAPYWTAWLTRLQLYWKLQNSPPEK